MGNRVDKVHTGEFLGLEDTVSLNPVAGDPPHPHRPQPASEPRDDQTLKCCDFRASLEEVIGSCAQLLNYVQDSLQPHGL